VSTLFSPSSDDRAYLALDYAFGTAHTQAGICRNCRRSALFYNLDVNCYVTKPVDFNRFAHAVERLGLYWLQ